MPKQAAIEIKKGQVFQTKAGIAKISDVVVIGNTTWCAVERDWATNHLFTPQEIIEFVSEGTWKLVHE